MTGSPRHGSARSRKLLTLSTPDLAPADPAEWFESDPLWFKRAVFYEIHIRGFSDADDDGNGDLRGVTEKLDYLQWLGVDCIWLLPMYPSPLKDGGYDIADFLSVHPDYGTVADVASLLDAAHRRGIRVIADLVMNHTSSDHPWFQEARSDPASPKRDWYVWSDTDTRLPRRADHLHRHRGLELDVGPRRRPVLLASVLRAPAGPELRQPGGPGGDARRPPLLARSRPRRLQARCRAVPLRAGRDELREPARDARLPEARPCGGRRAVSRPGPAGRGEPVAGGSRRLFRERRRMSYGLSVPSNAQAIPRDPPRGRKADRRDPRADARDPRAARNGGSSCATTTSSRSRWSPTRSATSCTPSTRRTRA